jgi:hypothetical protein
MSYSSPDEKASIVEAEHGHGALQRRDDEAGKIDALGAEPNTTLESFSHQDEKKILRKVKQTNAVECERLLRSSFT